VVALVVTVSVDDPEPFTEAGANAPPAPAGSPVRLNDTVPVKPPEGVTVAVYVVLAPCATVREEGVAANPKSGVGGALQA